jgi:hypothetical protein
VILKLGLENVLVIPATWMLRQEHQKFEVSLGYVARPCVKKINKKSDFRT